MSAYLPIGALAGCVFSYGVARRDILVLKAFFDDSGTHGLSDVVVMGGIIATEAAWDAFEPSWDAELKRAGIDVLHMSKCERRDKPFEDWDEDKRRREYGIFSDLICETHGQILASAVSRKAWDAAIARSKLGRWFAHPIDFLFSTAMRRALETRRIDGDPTEEVVLTFDTRDQNIGFWTELASGYERRWPRVAGFALSTMKKSLPLQAADMIAYETFFHQCQVERSGDGLIKRDHMKKLMGTLQSHAGFYTEEGLVEYADALEAS